MKPVIAAAAFAAIALSASAAAAQDTAPAPADQVDNNGQDPSNPVTRVDGRIKYKDTPGDLESWTYTLRADKPFELGGGWKLSARIDLPFTTNEVRTATGTDSSTGFSDTLVQALFIAPPKASFVWAVGGQMIFPTGDDRFGTGKYQFVPTFAIIKPLPTTVPGSFIGVLLKDQFSFAGDSTRPGINDLIIQPIANLNLQDRWFVTFAPEIRIDMENSKGVFLPFDATIGRKLNDRLVASLQYDVGLVNDYAQYNWQLEARIGFFF